MSDGTMRDAHKKVGLIPLSIEKELKTSFLDYAMSVIVSRALPDVRDGLKPVHRRILYAMHRLGYYHDKPTRKSAAVVGEVMRDFHPHGGDAIYQTIVGMVQDFSKRYPLLDGQGNWGSIDGDNAAAMRYTEVRMARIAREVLADIDKETVYFAPNYDESITEPVLLPSKIPNLLINGSTGIAVGMATSIPPHNLGEVIDACRALLVTPEISDDHLYSLVPGPDFPTGGVICGRSGILKAYRTGHGSLTVRGIVEIIEEKKGSYLVIKELPYQVNKADLITKIAELVKNKVIEGISMIRDESSNREGIRIVIELRRSEMPSVVLNQLYKHTPLQTSISIMMLALYQNRPMIFSLREMLEHFIVHRREIVTRRTEYDLAKSKARAHIVQGLIIAVSHVDEIVALIKNSDSVGMALSRLQSQFSLSGEQAKAILEMRLQRFTGLERTKLYDEIEGLKLVIGKLEGILNDDHVLRQEIIAELEEVKKNYADSRRTLIEGSVDSLTDADLIPDDEVVITLTRKGYIKRVPLDTYEVQHRGGKGKKGMADLDEHDDVMQDAFVTKNHDELLFFTNLGRIYSLHVYQIPEGSRIAKGRAIVNLLELVEGEKVVRLLCTRQMENRYLVMVTRCGVIKKTDAMAFAKIRSTGIKALTLNDGDELAFCAISSGNDSIVIVTKHGQGIHFKEAEVRPMGRNAAGVRGISLRSSDIVVGLEVIPESTDLLIATSQGYGKRVRAVDFRIAHRGGLGVRSIPTGGRNGYVIGLVRVDDDSHILLIDTNGKIIRLSPQEVRTMGRQAKGVRLVRLDKDQHLTSLTSFNGDAAEKGLDEQALATECDNIDISSSDSVIIEDDFDGDLEGDFGDESGEE